MTDFGKHIIARNLGQDGDNLAARGRIITPNGNNKQYRK